MFLPHAVHRHHWRGGIEQEIAEADWMYDNRIGLAGHTTGPLSEPTGRPVPNPPSKTEPHTSLVTPSISTSSTLISLGSRLTVYELLLSLQALAKIPYDDVSYPLLCQSFPPPYLHVNISRQGQFFCVHFKTNFKLA